MKPGDLVRINLPEHVRSAMGYYYHGYLGLVVDTTVKDSFDKVTLFAEVLMQDGIRRQFSQRYLEALDETR